MGSYSFSVNGTPKQVCVSGSDDRFEIKQVVDGEVVLYRVNDFPVFVGGSGGTCVTITDDGDYVIEWSEQECSGNNPVFTDIAVEPSDECCGSAGLDVEILDYCNLETRTVWYKTLWFEAVEGGPPVEHVLSDWADSGIVCSLPETECSPLVGEVFGATDDDFEAKPFTTLAVDNPSCCDVKIVTSAGEFTVRKGRTFDLSFQCDVQLLSVAPVDDGCDVSAVQVVYYK